MSYGNPSVVKTLNDMRPVWEPLGEYKTFSFERQPQTFPDVILRERRSGTVNVLLGIELKGWYLLAKEEVPTFRFTVTSAACNPWDLLAVVPWVLSNVLAGSPQLYRPFVQSSLYYARRRNHYWLYERQDSARTGKIVEPDGITPYPAKSDIISDRPTIDGGNNCGRLARYGLMNAYVKEIRDSLIRGILVREWQVFFKYQRQSL